MTAILVVVLVSIAALGVDLGNAMNRKQVTQNSADFAALAGANGLPDTGTATVQLVADYLNTNAASNDGGTECNPQAGSTITAAMLTDGIEANGEVTFPSGDTRIRVVSPAARVQFGMAAVMGEGFEDTCVGSVATARLSSGSLGMSPYYATEACDQGPQVLKSDAGGPSIPFSVPALFADGDSNNVTLSSVDPNPNPNQVPVQPVGNPNGPQITITGLNNMGPGNVDMVGFFNSDQSAPFTAAPLATPAQTSTQVTVNVPNEVASFQDVWWIRVRRSSDQKWSARSTARPLLVGEVTLSCDPESTSGNFGSIDFPWSNNPNDNIVKGIKDGVPPPMTLKTWPAPPYPGPNLCKGDPLGVYSESTSLKENTNCVNTTTGLRAGAAYDGLLKPTDGRLLVPTSSTCQTLGQPASGTFNENRDLLSCFLTNNTDSISKAVAYNGTQPLFIPEIWESPRFLLVPKLEQDPTGNKWMPIVDFVPAFITDEVTGSKRQSPVLSGDTDHGFVVHNKQVRAMRVFFFDIDALPAPPDGTPLQDYFGAGPKIVTMVN